jgi:ABC-type uncharacterized transport system substrate-binding protein
MFILSAAVLFFTSGSVFGDSSPAGGKKWKILHIMSYHMPWKWTEEQLKGFKEPLKDLDIEYAVFQMDTKRNSSEEWKRQKGKEAMDLIGSWKPDLVYTSDDDAQQYVTRHYVDSAIPFVFSGVNADPEKYGFTGSTNIGGVLEQEHFVESVKLLKEMVPKAEKIAVIVDSDPMWKPVTARMRSRLGELPHVRIASWDVIDTFAGFRKRMEALQGETDALALIGIFSFKDQSGKNVPYPEVLRWTAENSRLPDFSFWKDRVSFGTLCAVTVSEYEQGLAAGRIARSILVESISPSVFPMTPCGKGKPVISLARAKKLGIPVKTGLLLTAEVLDRFEWEK